MDCELAPTAWSWSLFYPSSHPLSHSWKLLWAKLQMNFFSVPQLADLLTISFPFTPRWLATQNNVTLHFHSLESYLKDESTISIAWMSDIMMMCSLETSHFYRHLLAQILIVCTSAIVQQVTLNFSNFIFVITTLATLFSIWILFQQINF